MAYQIQYGAKTIRKRKRKHPMLPLLILLCAVALRIWQPQIAASVRLLLFPPELQAVFSDAVLSDYPGADAIAVLCEEIFMP